MSATWHIIKKDLLYFRWALAAWFAGYAYLVFFQSTVSLHGNVAIADYFRLLSILAVGVISCAMLIGIVQSDHPTDSSAFWRTRPISPVRLVVAKLALIVGLFVGVPLATLAARSWFGPLALLDSPREYAVMALALGSVAFSVAAAASCTRNMAYALLLWFGVVFGAGALDVLLGRFWHKLPFQLAMQMNMNRMISILVLSVAASVAIILNQYVRRKLSASIGVLVAAAAVSALMGTLWSYYYFYQG